MENQPPSTNANLLLNRRSATPDERDAEITKLKDRLGFYESFDQIIQDNVARAGDLLRTAATMRENAEETLTIAKQEMEQSRVNERQDFRALLSGLLDDVTTMQVQVERLARKVADALDDIESSLPTSVDIDRLPSVSTDPLHALAADSVSEPWSSLTLDPTPEEIGPAETLETEAASVAAAASAVVDEPFEIEADMAAAEATEIIESAEYLAVESVLFADESSEAETAAGDQAPESASEELFDHSLAAVAQADVVEAIESRDEEIEISAGHDEGYFVVQREPQFDSSSTADNRPTVESLESDAMAAKATDPEASLPAQDEFAAEVVANVAPALHVEDEKAVESPVTAADESGEAIAGAEVEAAAAAGFAAEAETGIDAEAPLSASAGTIRKPESGPVAAPSESAINRSDIRPFPAGGLGSSHPRPGTGELRAQETARYAPPTIVALGSRGVGTVVLVHGVPRATTALSLKRFLESLPHVASVEPREYAEGVLRLHVTAQRPVQIDDLRGWADGAGFEPVHLREDLVEVRLPH